MSVAAVADTALPPSRHLEIGGLDYAYVDAGTGPPVVLVHGNPTWSFFFRELVAALPAAGYRAIAPDHVGMGRSAKPPATGYPYTLARRIEDLTDFLDRVPIHEPVTLVVHDWGGAIALGWAVRHSERVDRVVLLNTAAFPLPPGKRLPLALQVARAWPVGDVAVLYANAFARAATRLAVRYPMAPAARRGYLAPYDTPAHRVGVLRFVKDIPVRPGDPAHPVVSQIAERLPVLADRPVLICWGMRDLVFDARILTCWEKIFPHAEVHRFPDAGHYVLEDAGERIVPLVVDFLRRTSRRTSRRTTR